MASIYANSYLTIIAADGDSTDYRLRGLRGISGPRQLDQKVHRLSTRLQVVRKLHQNELYRSVWSTREWTFQEHIFSSRRLKFERQMVYWECDAGYWDEEKTGKNKRKDTQDPIEGLSAAFTSSFPSLDDYTELLRAYTSRVLSYSKDSLFAFSGITTALGRVFAGGFVSGLPMMFFDIALLWEPYGTSTWRAPVLDTHKNPCLPSWSWVGWEGKVSTHSWEAGNCCIKKSS